MSGDPEKVLAEALRAQAGMAQPAPPGDPPSPHAPPVVEPPGGYGLLSGAGAGSLERERAALDAQSPSPPVSPSPPAPPAPGATSSGPSEPQRSSAGLPVPWVLLLAVTLGLAAGSVIGLLTLL